MTAAPWPDHLLTLAEWDALPQDTSRCYELVEGVLLVSPRPRPLHQLALAELYGQIKAQLPDELIALPEVEVVVKAEVKTGERSTVRVPDLIVTPKDCVAADPPRLAAADVLVAIEIISPGTRTTDRVTKPHDYAHAGIPHYWIVDLCPSITFTAYSLVEGNYKLVAQDVEGTVTLDSPVGIALSLDALIVR